MGDREHPSGRATSTNETEMIRSHVAGELSFFRCRFPYSHDSFLLLLPFLDIIYIYIYTYVYYIYVYNIYIYIHISHIDSYRYVARQN